ncbi:MAG: hypothetical protein MUC36_07455 [Planctomycetes bacterium]|nr:hypothetical protein [Planctomycetota bacterium]
MDHELFEGAACAASDLTARLLAELATATGRLEQAERDYRSAAATGLPIPFAVRKAGTLRRREVSNIRHMLAGLPCGGEVDHAASA